MLDSNESDAINPNSQVPNCDDNDAATLVRSFPLLEELHLENAQLTAAGWAALALLPRLVRLQLLGASTEQIAQVVQRLSLLQSLQIPFHPSRCIAWVGAVLHEISCLSALRELRFDGIDCDAAACHLSRLTGLERLSVTANSARVTDATLMHISQSPNLQDLSFSNASARNITDYGLDGICRSEALQSQLHSLKLEFQSSMVTPNGLTHLSKLLELRSLELGDSSHLGRLYHNFVTDEAFSNIELPCLTRLVLAGLQLKSVGLRHLSRLENLKDLSLRGLLKVGDEGLLHVNHCSLITRLELTHLHRISRLSLSHVACLPALERLAIHSCPGICSLDHLSCVSSLCRLDVINSCSGVQTEVWPVKLSAPLLSVCILNLEHLELDATFYVQLRRMPNMQQLRILPMPSMHDSDRSQLQHCIVEDLDS